MKVFVLDSVTFFRHSNVISSAHYDMYHGVATRRGVRLPFVPKVHLEDDRRDPLHIVRSIDIIPELSRPGFDLVVSDRLRGKLAQFPNIEFLQVQFDRLVHFYCKKGDFSFFSEGRRDSEEYFVSLPDIPEAHHTIGSFYEIVMARNQTAAETCSGCHEFAIKVSPAPHGPPVVFRASAEMLAHYPITRAKNGYVLSEDFYAVLEPAIDLDYFSVGSTSCP